jgi:hypothetical protein
MSTYQNQSTASRQQGIDSRVNHGISTCNNDDTWGHVILHGCPCNISLQQKDIGDNRDTAPVVLQDQPVIERMQLLMTLMWQPCVFV